MRLFIAINFNDEVKDMLCEAVRELKSHSVKGNFTHRENMHLTIVFIGETKRFDVIKKVMDGIDAESFELSIGGFGSFRRDGGDICWIGVNKSRELAFIYEKLCSELEKSGFTIEKREYRPHLTLGREVVLNENFDRTAFEKTIPQKSTEVTKLSLMKSERINGKLTYTEIYGKTLNYK